MKENTPTAWKRVALFSASTMIFLYLLFILFADILNQLFRSSPNETLSFQVGIRAQYDAFFFLVLLLIVAFYLFIRFSARRIGGIQKIETGNMDRSPTMLTAMLFGATILEQTILFVLLFKGIGECFDEVISPCAGEFDMRTFFDLTLPLGKTTVFSFLLIFPQLNKVFFLFLFFISLVYTGFLQISPVSSYSKLSNLVLLNIIFLVLICMILVGTDFRSMHPLIGPLIR